ncbi:MAG TPA: dienelactone hydrolase family protein [Alphaproteobacteria bacterium]|nr:dienelactone hydrolase family protein [Alphaproteobacteria bacterium]
MQGRKVAVPTRDGKSMSAEYFAAPGAYGPAIVMVPAIFGLHDPERAVAASYAELGFSVLVPDMFFRTIPGALAREGAERDQAQKRYAEYDAAQGALDIGDAIAFLKTQEECSGKVAAFGYCFGGRLAFLAAATGAADGAVTFHGTKLGDEVARANGVNCPLQIHVGDADPQIPMEETRRVQAALAGKKDIGVFVYPGIGHGFTNQGKPSYSLLADSMARAGALAMMASLAD